MIEVTQKSCCDFTVIINRESQTKHIVTLSDIYYTKLAKGKITKLELIKKSFEFLLTKESQHSIMSKFNLKIIGNYFPDFENVVGIKRGGVDL